MDPRSIKFWDDGQALLQSAGSDPARRPQLMGKMVKELRTMGRFLQRNQSQRFSDNAQQKVVDALGAYVTFSKQLTAVAGSAENQLSEAAFQTVKDALAMPFNVMGTKQKKRLLKWYNELIAIVGGDPDASLEMMGLDGDATTVQRMEWSVLGIDDDGYLSLLNEETGEMCETIQVPKKSDEYRHIRKGVENAEVVVVTAGDAVVEVKVSDE